MNNEYITLVKLTAEIYRENSSDTLEVTDSFERTMRKKFSFLMNRVVMRSKLDWRYKEKDRIPLKDKSIVKALLTKSCFPDNDPSDLLFVKWFNGSIEDSDFDSIIQLGYQVELLLDDITYDDWDLDDVTIDEWKTAIESSINLSRALSVKKFAYEMIQLYDSSNVLNHDIPLGDMIKENNYGKLSYVWKGLHPTIDMSLPLKDVLNGCFSQEDYTKIVLQLMFIIMQDCKEKTINFIKAYAEVKRETGCGCIDKFIGNDSLASEYPKFFQNIYEYLYDRPDLTRRIEDEIGTDNLLEFFKMKDRNVKNPKKSKKDK